MKRRIFTRAFAALTVVLGLAAELAAQSVFTWKGGSYSGSVSNAKNWQEGEGLYYNVEIDSYGTGIEELVFGPAQRTTVSYSGSLRVASLHFTGGQPYRIQGTFNSDGGAGSLYLSDGIVYDTGRDVVSQIYDSVRPTGDQTWAIKAGRLEIHGPLMTTHEGDSPVPFTINKTGNGTLSLLGPINGNNYLGTESTLRLTAGYLELRPSAYTALGLATLEFNGGTLVAAPDNHSYSYDGGDQELYLRNPIVSNGLISTFNRVSLYLAGMNVGSIAPISGTEGTLPTSVSNGLTLNADTTIMSQGEPLYIGADITEAGGSHSLTIDSSGAVVLLGNNSYTGGTHVENGVLIFADRNAIPRNYLDSQDRNISATATGYVGFGDYYYSESVQGYFIDAFDKAAMAGTIGFDTDPDSDYPTDFSGSIDLTGFNATARLGTATQAILSGNITPQGADYRFGGGGGTLVVDSTLTDGPGGTVRNLVLDSPDALPLTVRLTRSENSFTGTVEASHSALIFANGAEESLTGDFNLHAGGYIGTENDDPAAFLAHFNAGSAHGMVGFDGGGDGYGRQLSDTIDLGRFTGQIYLGTATPLRDGAGLTLTGDIFTTNDNTDPYRFAGYKGGALEVASTLVGSRDVLIGDPTSPATFGDYFNETYSTVALSGDNDALTGDVVLYAGQLLVGQSNNLPTFGTLPVPNYTTALGHGTLVVESMTLPALWHDDEGYPPPPALGVLHEGIIIPNDIALNANLNIGWHNNFELAGKISGAGALNVEGGLTLTLSGDNDFTGGIYLDNGAGLVLHSNTAAGAGVLGFGSDSNSDYSQVFFHTDAPVIGGLQSDNYAELIFSTDSAVLTIDQSINSVFRGGFDSYTEGNAARIVKTGAGTLRLDGGMYFDHGTYDISYPGDAIPGTGAGPAVGPDIALEVKRGAVVLTNNFYIQNSDTTFHVTGYWDGNAGSYYSGTLALEGGKVISNPIVVDNGGRLAGNGSFTSPIAINGGAILSPGMAGIEAPIGLLRFDQLDISDGGIYEWHVKGLPAPGITPNDVIEVDGALTLSISNGPNAQPITIRITSLNADNTPGSLIGLDPSHGTYAWTLFTFDSLTNSFDPNVFNLDYLTTFSSDVPGSFTIFQQDNQIMLGFTPVPEPSTYALMALGLGFIAWMARRRRSS